ncbi:MAG TPA: YbjN domain-containing protein [Candidatus Obscuribacter sp.]|nr:YbjN domain-containing protein [Candidatus Melainabacteria bacterium]MDX1990455.1 YbjN domain-containing protein [Candidatus Obscuribacter sp.]HMW92293.1 YbjN domain-containing protein [Candidatus Obscuribacter sp.]HMX45836.1 YbjN domain-containing protein [Candidatus Obscuribacter sp.]HMY02254.1 YbjN domain-containing protein [Candidatus Obscuribacter sp.]
MGIFGAQKVNVVSAQEAKDMVEEYFAKRGLVAADHVLADAGGLGWWLMEGSARVYILVQEGPKDTRGKANTLVRITAPLVYLPETGRELFYRRLLDLNGNLSLCALSTHDDVVLVVAQRPTTGLDQEELDDMVWHVAYVADLLDNKLAEEYGCKMYRN